jgi:hypothetical protein
MDGGEKSARSTRVLGICSPDSCLRNHFKVILILHPPHLQYDAFGDAVFIFLADSLDGYGQFHFVQQALYWGRGLEARRVTRQ